MLAFLTGEGQEEPGTKVISSCSSGLIVTVISGNSWFSVPAAWELEPTTLWFMEWFEFGARLVIVGGFLAEGGPPGFGVKVDFTTLA